MKRIAIEKLFIAVMALLLTAPMLSGCGDDQDLGNAATTEKTAAADDVKLSGSVIVAGSTSVQPLVQELADVFSEMEEDVEIDVQGGGSTAGIEAVISGVADIGTVSRELSNEEKAYGLALHLIAVDGIAVIVNPNNPVSDLAKDQIARIYKGEIKNWKEVGGPDMEILVVQREASSGTREAFEELIGLKKKEGDKTVSMVRSDALIADSNGVVQTQISTKKNAIGYMSLGMVDSTVKTLKIDGVEPSAGNIGNKTYSLWRPFLLLTKGELSPEAQAFIDFIKSEEGQKIVSRNYISYTAVQQ